MTRFDGEFLRRYPLRCFLTPGKKLSRYLARMCHKGGGIFFWSVCWAGRQKGQALFCEKKKTRKPFLKKTMTRRKLFVKMIMTDLFCQTSRSDIIFIETFLSPLSLNSSRKPGVISNETPAKSPRKTHCVSLALWKWLKHIATMSIKQNLRSSYLK